MQTTLINLHNKSKRCDVKIDRTTSFGNFVSVIGRDGDRKQVVEKYRKWFYKKILTDDEFRDRIQALKGKVIGCWCTPLECHGDVIIEYLNDL